MTVHATLIDAGGNNLPVLALALYSELNRFPRLYVVVAVGMEGMQRVVPGALTLNITREFGGPTLPLAISRSTWHLVSTQTEPQTQSCLLQLCAAPNPTLEVRAFARNDASAKELLASVLEPYVPWREKAQVPARIEAFVSVGETFEQCARRLALLTNEAFRLCLNDAGGWQLDWSDRVLALGDAGAPETTGVTVVVQTEHPLESAIQRGSIPASPAPELASVSDATHAFFSFSAAQLGQSGATACAAEPAASENGESLTKLQTDLLAFTDVQGIFACWTQARVQAAGNPEAVVLSSLFLYDGKPVDSCVSLACQALVRHLGLRGDGSQLHAEGWSAYALAVPLSSLPADKRLLTRLMHTCALDDLWQRLVQTMGCGNQLFACTPANTLGGALLAVVAENPNAVECGAVSRSLDDQAYRSKIWVRLIGVDGVIEIDWALPFASHDNTAVGGRAGSELILVPEKNTLGYVSFLATTGAPFFHAMTHYRDTNASPHIQPADYRHGLVTDGNFCLRERGANVWLDLPDKMILTARQMRKKLFG